MHDCFAGGTSLRVDEVAQQLHLHPSYLSRRFKAVTGMRLGAYLKERQIAEAQRLLVTTDLDMEMIARHAGLGTANTLFRVFRTRVGMTPLQYRQRRAAW